jgi:hypothetical protein
VGQASWPVDVGRLPFYGNFIRAAAAALTKKKNGAIWRSKAIHFP